MNFSRNSRVISGEPVALPAVVSLCCGVARRVIDKFGEGVTEEQARGLVEALVHRLDLGISGEEGRRHHLPPPWSNDQNSWMLADEISSFFSKVPRFAVPYNTGSGVYKANAPRFQHARKSLCSCVMIARMRRPLTCPLSIE